MFKCLCSPQRFCSAFCVFKAASATGPGRMYCMPLRVSVRDRWQHLEKSSSQGLRWRCRHLSAIGTAGYWWFREWWEYNVRLTVVQAQLRPACSCFEAIWDELLKIKKTIYAAHEELRKQTHHAENRWGLPLDKKWLFASSGKAWFSTRFGCFREYRCGDTAPGIKLT